MSAAAARWLAAFTFAAALWSVAHAAEAGRKVFRSVRPEPHRIITPPPNYDLHKAIAKELLVKFPPHDSFYVSVGRSTAALEAFLEASAEMRMSVTLPASRIGRYAINTTPVTQLVDQRWPDYQEHLQHYVPIEALAGKKRIVLFDCTGGTSTEVVRYALRRYLAEAWVTDVEIFTVSTFSQAVVAPHQTAREPFVQRLAVDYRTATTYPRSDAEDYAAPYTAPHVIGDGPQGKLHVVQRDINPNRPTLISQLREALRSDADWHQFLTQNFPDLLGDD